MQIKRIVFLFLALCILIPCASAETFPAVIPETWLIANLGTADAPEYTKVAEVAPFEDYLLIDVVAGLEPELYYAPEDENSPVRFIYYTTGMGSARTMAENALASYGAFYEDFAAGEITEIELNNHSCIYFTYTCSYAAMDGVTPVYEQTAICYYPVSENAFVACIYSQAFDSAEDRYDDEAMTEALSEVASTIVWDD